MFHLRPHKDRIKWYSPIGSCLHVCDFFHPVSATACYHAGHDTTSAVVRCGNWAVSQSPSGLSSRT